MSKSRTIRTKIVGVTKRNDEGESIQDLLEGLDGAVYQGDLLDLEHESDNPYDENAIKVFCKGDHIGYIKKDLAAEIAADVDRDCVRAEMDEITGGDGLTYGCNIILTISDEPIPYTSQPRKKIEIPDDLLEAGKAYIIKRQTVDTADLQRGLKIGYSKAAALMDKMEDLGYVSPFIGFQPRKVLIYQKPLIDRIFKPVLAVCLAIIVVCAVVISTVRRKEQKVEAWDRKAVATAMISLDQYAPDTDYGKATVTGWTVVHNSDGTTTVWAPAAYGRISVMLTDDGENYTPYYISVDGEVMLGQ